MPFELQTVQGDITKAADMEAIVNARCLMPIRFGHMSMP